MTLRSRTINMTFGGVVGLALLTLIVAATTLPAYASEKAWVTAERLNRRTCPATNCGIVGRLFYREGVQIFEKRGEWARITKHYDASCFYGQSEYVDAGNAACTTSNGINDGKFAEWVSLKYLAATQPADPAAGAEGTAKLVGHSDDYARYKAAFVKAADDLMASGRCTRRDLVGGWTKSVSNYRNEPVYFIYCGGSTTSNRIYLDASNGQIFR